jgi:predicted helicase
MSFERDKISLALYRPFQKVQFYHGEKLISMRYQNDKFFPTSNTKNLVIAVSGIGANKEFSCLISNNFIDLQLLSNGQAFPLYYFENLGVSLQKTQKRLTGYDAGDKESIIRRDGISNHTLKSASKVYGNNVSKEDIFYYVYGILHSPAYRETFKDNLNKSLPRSPFVERANDFWAFSKAGRELARLHLEYENEPPFDGVEVVNKKENYKVSEMEFLKTGVFHVSKMKFLEKENKDIIIFIQDISIENIPKKAYEYVVNGKSAIEWIMERYQIKTDKDSGIVNDPNTYAEEIGKPRYILDLLLSVIAVSVKTMEIVENLPKLEL